MPWKIPLEDGGDIEFSDSCETVDIGNGLGVPERFRYVHPGGPDQPAFRAEFGVINKIPVCLGIHIEAKDDIPVRTADLKLVHVDKLIISAVGAAAKRRVPSRKPGHRQWKALYGDTNFNEENLEVATRIVKGKPRTRRKADDVDLQLVADTWRAAHPGNKTQALRTVFMCSRATALRYKKRAVEEGFLDE